MPKFYSQQQLQRDALPVLRCLAKEDSYLVQMTGSNEPVAAWSSRNNFAKPIGQFEKPLVEQLLTIGLLETGPLDRVVMSKAGRELLVQKSGRKAKADKVAVSNSPVTNDAESPLAWLAKRKGPDGRPLLTQEMIDAGERLRRDFETAQLGDRVTASWDASILSGARGRSGLPGQTLNLAEAAIDARRRVWKALQSVGPGLSSILLEVCCLASGLEAAERHLKWPKRSAKLVLILALERLANHYGYFGTQLKRGKTGIAGWGLDDYRPDLLGHLAEAVGQS